VRCLPTDRHSPLLNAARYARAFLAAADPLAGTRYSGFLDVSAHAELDQLILCPVRATT
jgi:hypothetical protein